MRRREFITVIGGGAAAWPLTARAHGAMPVIGFLSTLPSGENPTQAAFRRGLAEEGYVEGKNLAIEKRFTNFRPEQPPSNSKVSILFVESGHPCWSRDLNKDLSHWLLQV